MANYYWLVIMIRSDVNESWKQGVLVRSAVS